MSSHASGQDAASVPRCEPSGISILVIGAGVGGLTAALECWRKGHNVRVLERHAGPDLSGKSLSDSLI